MNLDAGTCPCDRFCSVLSSSSHPYQEISLRGGAVSQIESKSVLTWTINIGGLPGFWRVFKVISALEEQLRPDLVAFQELCCRHMEWKTILPNIQKLGYNLYANDCVRLEKGTAGCGLLVKTKWHQKFVDMNESDHGGFVAVAIHNTMFISYYARPRDLDKIEVATCLEQWFESCRWHGHRVILGDFNEEFHDSYISSVSAFHGLEYLGPDEPTRWSGQRCIDYVLHDVDVVKDECSLLPHQVSDHKIVSCSLNVKACEQPEFTLFKQMSFDKPQWLTQEQWVQTVKFAFQHCVQTQWKEACMQVASNLGATPDTVDDQDIVDFSWTLVGFQLLSVFRHAFFVALLEMPENWQDRVEDARVAHLASRLQNSRVTGARIVKRTFPKDKRQFPLAVRKLHHKLGRCWELKRHVMNGRFNKDTKKIMDKVPEIRRLDLQDINEVIQQIEAQIEQCHVLDKQKNITRWKHAMQTDPKQRTSWLLKPRVSDFGAILKKDTGEATQNKEQAAAELHRLWSDLHASVAVGQDQLNVNIQELTLHIQNRTKHLTDGFNRPSFKNFLKAISKVKGSPGIDQWSPADLKVISKIPELGQLLWSAMSIWEQCATTPTTLQQVRITFIPKKKDQGPTALPRDFRPIAVYSIMWRLWTSAWILSDQVKDLALSFPETVALNKDGPEVLAAIADSYLQVWKKGVSLDFTLCFDTVSLKLIAEAFQKGLPAHLVPWSVCVTGHWLGTQKFIQFNGHTFSKKYCSEYGLPQGDAASPLALAILLSLGYSKVLSNHENRFPAQNLFQMVYVDDRTMIASSWQVLDGAIDEWQRFATQYGLVENPAKMQKCDLESWEMPNFMEVLGCVIGNPSAKQYTLHVQQEEAGGCGCHC